MGNAWGVITKEMKRIIALSPVLVAVLVFALLGVQQASALEFETRITNQSGSAATVDVYTKGSTGAAAKYSSLTIPNNTTSDPVTFLGLTGLCLSYLVGQVGNSSVSQMPCTGSEGASTTERCCANLNFRIYKRNDGTYHFQRLQ